MLHKFRNFVEDEPAVEERLSTSYRGDDLMTPPDVLLQLSMKEAEKAANLNVNRNEIFPFVWVITYHHLFSGS